jgi:hypothetical protein
MGGVKRPEFLIVGGALGLVCSYLAGGWVDDALGHDGHSLLIAEIVTVVVMAAFAVPSVILALRSGKR